MLMVLTAVFLFEDNYDSVATKIGDWQDDVFVAFDSS
jgi:hypothetical protein